LVRDIAARFEHEITVLSPRPAAGGRRHYRKPSENYGQNSLATAAWAPDRNLSGRPSFFWHYSTGFFSIWQIDTGFSPKNDPDGVTNFN
jgi:hypothetical protein